LGGYQGGFFAGSRVDKIFISNAGFTPLIVNNTMFHHLEVNGSARINKNLHIVEASGTSQNANNGTIVLDHENNGGASSIVFRSKVNRGSDYGYIQYQDSSSVGASGESCRLILGTASDTDDHIILLPSGNVGIGTNTPSQKLTVVGNINASQNITAVTYNAVTITATGTGSGTTLQNSGSVNCNGSLYMSVNRWHHGGGREVFYFESSGKNNYRGGSASDTSIHPHNFKNRDNSNLVSITHTGNVRSVGPYTNLSDERTKKDIVDVDDTIALEKILLIQPKKYKYVDEEMKGSHEVLGFIAQQIKTVIPYAVELGEEKLANGEEVQDFHYLDKMAIYTLNVAATQEIHRIIMRQQTVIDGSIARLEVLES